MSGSSKYRTVILAIALATGIGYGAAELLVPVVVGLKGEVLTTYTDVAGVNMVCYGDTDPAMAVPGVTYSGAECLESLSRQIIAHTRSVLGCVPGACNGPTK